MDCKSARSRLGITLVEVLVTLAIILLLAGLTFPIYRAAKREAFKADAIAKAKQVGIGLQLYHTEYGQWPENHLGEAVISGHLDPVVLHVKGDPKPDGLAHWIEGCQGWTTPLKPGTRNSFEDVFAETSTRNVYITILEKHDQNYALVAYRGLGDWLHGNTPECFGSLTGYQGRIVRARLDGSVSTDILSDRSANGELQLCYAALFSDVDPNTLCAETRK